ncbi:RagB/SusD family nutrient uptake outer membrane protein [Tenacibaculum sp. 1_MG-2023]|uniref:RagB/SusD family nutrient uptake outer membrane protein n=1 Tax=Tenacibaculum sp. 1_MG-2023 TaxID=3062653 RepID=UPI0026E32C27|nr:RagB/SusD family nutrient uptake outer membrane protein [Tenacibaculum sp. 1_MG-2023]MDO6675501.1 RagB/SusD family nutrient uptake outer membrane protein [Tenacibaculum sp. 1_MG-2023]
MIKKISKILFIGVFAILTTSCSDQLDIPSEASLNANDNLATEDVDKLLTGLHKKMRHPNQYGYFAIMNTEIMGDNYKPVKFQWFQVQNFYENKVPAGDILLSYFYADYYAGIDRANTILKVPSANEAQKGAARYNRALSYLRLYDMFERVPLVDENYDRTPIAPSSKEDVLNFIVEDLKYAKANCVSFNGLSLLESQKTPTKEAASALLARVYRVKGNIVAAGTEAEELITSGKFTLAVNPLERDPEVIFMYKGNKAEEAGSWGWIMSPEARTWNCFAAADDLTALVKGEDTRKILFDFDGKEDNGGYIYSKKYKTEDNSDLLISRIAEMYLISAEAGNTTRLDELQAARKSSLTLAEERRLEMSFEWTRWEDLKLEGKTSYILPYPTRAVDSNPLLK